MVWLCRRLATNKKKLIKEFVFYYVFLIFLVNMHGFFLWETKKGIIITNDFQTISDMSNRKPNKVWVDKGSKFCSRLIKSWFTT